MEDGILFGISGSALTALGAMLGSWRQAKKNSRRIESQPLEVRQVGEFVSKADCARCADKQDATFKELFGLVRGLTKDMNDRHEGYSNQLGRMTTAVEFMKSKMERWRK